MDGSHSVYIQKDTARGVQSVCDEGNPSFLLLAATTRRVEGLTPVSGLSSRYAATSSGEAGFDLSLHHCNAKTMPDGLTRDDAPVPSTAPTLDLDCYLAMRKTAHRLRWGRRGRMECPASAHRLGAVDIAMIGLMRDAKLRVSKAAALTWGDIEGVQGGSGRVCIGGYWGGQLARGECRHDQALVARPSRRRLGRAHPGHEAEPDSHSDRRGGETGGDWRGLSPG